MKILSLGCGNMGAAILSGVLRDTQATAIAAIDPNVESARDKLGNAGQAEIFASLQDAATFDPDVVLLAIKPLHFPEIAVGLAGTWSEALIVSVMAGTSVHSISSALGTNRIVRVMPNLPAMVGAGMSVGYGGTTAEADRATVRRLFESVGAFEWLDNESLIDSCTAVSGSGPGYVFAFAAAFERAALAEGIPAAIAAKLTRQTIHGAAEMLNADSRSALALKQAVTSKAGTTEAGLAVLEAAGALPDLLPEAVRAAHLRARELSQPSGVN